MSAGAGGKCLHLWNFRSIMVGYEMQFSNPDIDATASRANGLTVAKHLHERTV